MPLALSIDTGLFDSVFATFVVMVPCAIGFAVVIGTLGECCSEYFPAMMCCCCIFGLDVVFAVAYGFALLAADGTALALVQHDLNLVSLVYGANTTQGDFKMNGRRRLCGVLGRHQ